MLLFRFSTLSLMFSFLLPSLHLSKNCKYFLICSQSSAHPRCSCASCYLYSALLLDFTAICLATFASRSFSAGLETVLPLLKVARYSREYELRLERLTILYCELWQENRYCCLYKGDLP